jgi:hypothetical protein
MARDPGSPLVRFERVPRLPRAPGWALAAGAGLAGLAFGTALVERRWGIALTTCMFKRFTGQPCPTCGATRGFLALLAGHPLEALAWNPLLFAGVAAAGIWLLLRLCAGLQPRFGWTPRGRRILLLVALAAVLADWAYLVARGV